MTATADDDVELADEDTRRTLRDVRRVARLLLQGLEPDSDGPNLLGVLEDHLGVRPDTLPVTSEEIPVHRTVDSDMAIAEIAGAFDGIDSDADVAFLLTTNRVEQLERALTQRPGRVDLAAEIPLPDEQGRRALVRLYAGPLFSDGAVDAVARGSEGTTASFAKELVRRAVLLAAAAGSDPGDEHLAAALDALQSDSEALTRSLLGTG